MGEKLAIDGGQPVRTLAFPSWPVWDDTEEELLLEVLHSGQWGILNGGKVSEFERQFSEFVGAKRTLCVTSGTTALEITLRALGVGPGDEVITTPYTFVATPSAAFLTGAKPVFVNTHEEDGFQLRPEDIKKKIGPKTKAILINSPSNPTGNLLSSERMEQITGLGPSVISDEIYHGLVYGEKERSILEFSDNAFVLNGFSKLYAMTGWRLGYLIAPSDFIRPLQKIQQNFFISAGSISQWAGLAALRKAEPDVKQMKSIYDERRRYMIQRVRELGLGLSVEPAGAFYMLVNVKHIAGSSYDLAFDILENAGVGVTPGIDFGQNAEGFLRLSYANSLDNIKEGLDRLQNYLDKR